MSLPNETQVREWFDTLRRLYAAPVKGEPCKRGDQLERDIIQYLLEDKRGSDVVRDGFPSATLGAGGSRTSSIPVDPENPEAGTVSLTSVEAAAYARMTRPERDKFHELVESALDFIHQAVMSLGAAEARIAAIKSLRGDAPVSNERWCESHLSSMGEHVPLTQKVKHATDVAGRLSRPRFLCGSCYDFVSTHGRLPIRDEFPAPGKSRWRVRTPA